MGRWPRFDLDWHFIFKPFDTAIPFLPIVSQADVKPAIINNGFQIDDLIGFKSILIFDRLGGEGLDGCFSDFHLMVS